jgi:hypothetical protein
VLVNFVHRLPMQEDRILLFSSGGNVQTGSGARTVFYRMGAGVFLFPGLKRPECEAYLSPPSSPEPKIMWSYTCTPSGT